MKSIFESAKSFEDAFVDFNVIKSDNHLLRFLIKTLAKPNQKTPLIWQMKGNQLCTAVENCIDMFRDDTDYYIVRKGLSPKDVLDYPESHIYLSKEEANSDNTSGFIIFNEFSGADASLRNFVVDLIKNNKYFVAKNWRVIVLANTDLGNKIWIPEYDRIFNNLEYDPRMKSDRYANSDEDLNDNKNENPGKENISEGFTNDTEFMSIDEAKEKIYTIIYNAALKNEISPDEYIYIDEDGIIVDSESGFDADMLYYARKASDFIDFDALSDGKVVIYTKPLYMFIEETINSDK